MNVNFRFCVTLSSLSPKELYDFYENLFSNVPGPRSTDEIRFCYGEPGYSTSLVMGDTILGIQIPYIMCVVLYSTDLMRTMKEYPGVWLPGSVGFCNKVCSTLVRVCSASEEDLGSGYQVPKTLSSETSNLKGCEVLELAFRFHTRHDIKFEESIVVLKAKGIIKDSNIIQDPCGRRISFIK